MTTLPFEISIEKEEILEKLSVHDIIEWIEMCDEDDEMQLIQYIITQTVPDLSKKHMVKTAYIMTESLNLIIDAVSPSDVE